MHPFYLLYVNYRLAQPSDPTIEQYSIPDDSMTSLQTIEDYLYREGIVNDNMHMVYMCQGHILHDRTDTNTLRFPILGCLLDFETNTTVFDPLSASSINTNLHTTVMNRLHTIMQQLNTRTASTDISEQELDIPVLPNDVFPNFIAPNVEPYSVVASNARPLNSQSSDVVPYEPNQQSPYESLSTNEMSELQSPVNNIEAHRDVIALLTEQLLSNVARMTSVPQQSVIHPQIPVVYTYATQMGQMRDMGFTNELNLRIALDSAAGDVDEAITIYMTLTET